jgi:hypothetical protein
MLAQGFFWMLLECLVFILVIPLSLIWFLLPCAIPVLMAILLLKLIFRKGG